MRRPGEVAVLFMVAAALALMSHPGWVTALCFVANHMLVKRILLLAAGAIILRTGARRLDQIGGLAEVSALTLFVLPVLYDPVFNRGPASQPQTTSEPEPVAEGA